MRRDGAHDRTHLAYRRGQQHQVGTGHDRRIVARCVDHAEFERARQIGRVAAEADHTLRRTGGPEPERERAPDQTDAENDYRIEAGAATR